MRYVNFEENLDWSSCSTTLPVHTQSLDINVTAIISISIIFKLIQKNVINIIQSFHQIWCTFFLCQWHKFESQDISLMTLHPIIGSSVRATRDSTHGMHRRAYITDILLEIVLKK